MKSSTLKITNCISVADELEKTMHAPNQLTGRLLTAIDEASMQFERLEALFRAIRDGLDEPALNECLLADLGVNVATRSAADLARISRDFSDQESLSKKRGA
ncbi:hypothetical protein [Burkholderia cenocepacia]|uniref:hypothetical protein n=1 Tax=Burkholderia cenocepacia TaxID=95486 RepID=UPI002AB2C13E|nr:hypothetical protein [Burkholderia cenocepacia]